MQTEQHATKKNPTLIFKQKPDLQGIDFFVVKVSLAENDQSHQVLLIK